MNDTGLIEIDVTFTRQDENDEKETFAVVESGASNQVRRIEQRGLTGVEIALIALVTVQAFTTIITRLSRLWHSGVIVDARGSKVRTTKDPNLPPGIVVMIQTDGVRTELHEPKDEQLLPIIARLAHSS